MPDVLSVVPGCLCCGLDDRVFGTLSRQHTDGCKTSGRYQPENDNESVQSPIFSNLVFHSEASLTYIKSALAGKLFVYLRRWFHFPKKNMMNLCSEFEVIVKIKNETVNGNLRKIGS